MIIGIDTSSDMTSVAALDDGVVVAEARHRDARRHAEVLAPMLAAVLDRAGRAEVDAVACGVGPGPYTGLRVGIATANALGLALGVPVVGLCSLDALAAEAVAQGCTDAFAVASDARRREVYWARYAPGGRREDGPFVGRMEDLDPDVRGLPWFGNGIAAVDGARPEAFADATWVARCVADLRASGETVDGDVHLRLSAHGEGGDGTAQALAGRSLLPPRPLYLRRPDAVETAAR